MANSVTHAWADRPIKGCRWSMAIPYLDADGDPLDPTTPDTEVSKDGAAFADCTEEVTTIAGSNGMGYLTLTGDETNCTLLCVAAKVGSGPKNTLASFSPRVLPSLSTGTAQAGAAGSITLAADAPAYDLTGCIVKTTGGTGGGGGSGSLGNQARLITAYDTSTKVATVEPNWETPPGATTTYAILLAETATILGTGAIRAASFAPGAIDATAIASNAIDADALKTDGVAKIADAVWDEATTGHTGQGTFGEREQPVRANSAQAGGSITITLDASASASDDFYVNQMVMLTAGTGAGQSRKIVGYNGTTKVATLDSDWVTAPDATTKFVIQPDYVLTGSGATPTEIWSYLDGLLRHGLKSSNAVSLDGGAQYLTALDSPSLSMGDVDFTIGAWFYIDANTVPGDTTVILTKGSNLTNACEYGICLASGSLYFTVGNNSSRGDLIVSVPAVKGWHFVVCWHDATGDKIYGQYDDGTPTEAGYSGGSYDGGNALAVGANVAPTAYFPGKIDQAFVIKRILTSAERSYLYKGGSGRRYAELGQAGTDGADLTGFAGWWELEETGDDLRLDSSGNANDLTAHGTPEWGSGVGSTAADLLSYLARITSLVQLTNPTASEVASAVWAAVSRTLTDAGVVWDSLSTGHTSAGKAGAQLWTVANAIAAVTAKLDALLEADGALYRFTTRALVNGPAGTGGSITTEGMNIMSETLS